MINIIVSRGYWQLDVFCNCNHFLLAISNLVFLVYLRHGEWLGVDHAFLLRGHDALLLDVCHYILRRLMLLLHHLLQNLLIGNWSHCYLSIHWVVVFLLVSEHLFFSSSMQNNQWTIWLTLNQSLFFFFIYQIVI